jgi:hypothetical protein
MKVSEQAERFAKEFARRGWMWVIPMRGAVVPNSRDIQETMNVLENALVGQKEGTDAEEGRIMAVKKDGKIEFSLRGDQA